MKKTLLSALFFCFYAAVSVYGSGWEKFSEDCSEGERIAALSSHSPLLRLEIRRHKDKDKYKDLVDINAYKIKEGKEFSVDEKSNERLKPDPGFTTVRDIFSSYISSPITAQLFKGSNVVKISGFSIPKEYNFDLVTNMKLDVLGDITSHEGIRVFSEHEVLGREHIKGKSCKIFPILKEGKEGKKKQEITYENLKKTLEDHLQENPKLFNSSEGKDIVAVLGKTGAGKSTLLNYLNKQELKAEVRDIILSNPSDKSAMAIGVGKDSQTRLPQFVDIEGLLFYDLPGLDDTGGIHHELINASFIKHIIENARTTRLVVVAELDEFTVGRGQSLKKLIDRITELLPKDINISTCSSCVITKSDIEEKELVGYLKKKVDEQYLSLWLRGSMTRISQMSKPQRGVGVIDLAERDPIMKSIKSAKSLEIRGLNITTLYSVEASSGLKEVIRQAMTHSLKKLESEIDAEIISAADNEKSLQEIVINPKRFEEFIHSPELTKLLKYVLSKEDCAETFSLLEVDKVEKTLRDKIAGKIELLAERQKTAEEKARADKAEAKPPKIEYRTEYVYRDPPTSSTAIERISTFYKKHAQPILEYKKMSRREKALYKWDLFLEDFLQIKEHITDESLRSIQKSIEGDLVKDISGRPVKASNDGRLVLVNVPYIIKHGRTGLPIDASSSFVGERWVYVSTDKTCNHDENKDQQWYFVHKDSNYYSIVLESTNLPIFASDSGKKWVYVHNSLGENYSGKQPQQWYFDHIGDDYYQIRKKVTSDCLEAQNSGSKYLYGTKSSADKWYFR